MYNPELDKDVKEFFLRSVQRMPEPRKWSTEVKTTVIRQSDNETSKVKQDPGSYITKNSNTNAQPAQ